MRVIDSFPPSPAEFKKMGAKYVADDSFYIGSGIVWTDDVYSCVAVALYDPEKKSGALAHFMRCTQGKLSPGFAVDTLLEGLGRRYDPVPSLEATVVGDCENVGLGEMVRSRLVLSPQISIVAVSLFDKSRTKDVLFDASTGEVTIYRHA
jgi:chemotaxis receptor (MCP) glutamine deamidase CheD